MVKSPRAVLRAGRLSRLEVCITEVQRPSEAGLQAIKWSKSMKAKRAKASRRSHRRQPGPIRPSASMPMVNPHAAGIDLGATEHWVCVPEDAVPEGEANVQAFGAYSVDLDQLVEWLRACGIETVAMEAKECTGSRWFKSWSKPEWRRLSQRAPPQARARAQERCKRLPVDPATAQLWFAQRVISAGAGHLCFAQLSTSPAQSDRELRQGSAAHAKSVTANECPFASCGE